MQVFDQSVDPHQSVILKIRVRIEHAIAIGLFAWHFLNGDEIAAGFRIGLNHLLQAGFGVFDHIIRQNHGKRIVADQLLGAPDGMAEPEGFGLEHFMDGRLIRQSGLQKRQFLCFAALFEQIGVFLIMAEMLHNGLFFRCRDKNELGDAGCGRLLHSPLDQRLVDDRQHFFGNRFCRGQKTGSHAGDRKNNFFDWLAHDIQNLLVN